MGMNNQPDEGPMNHIASLLELANYRNKRLLVLAPLVIPSLVKRISCNLMISVLLSRITVKIFC